MPLRFIVAVIVTAVLHGQTAPPDDPGTRSVERTLAAVLQFEILWNDSPKGFRLPSDGSIALAIHATSNSTSYCRHQAGVCVTYRTGDHRNWEGSETGPCNDDRSDVDALLSFVQKDSATRDALPATGARGFAGFPAAGSGITWTAKLVLGSRVEMVAKYRQMHPPELASLQKWLRSQMAGDSELKSITVACFAETDPEIYYYVDRPTKGPIERPTSAPTIVAAFWRLDQPEEWVVAGYSQRRQNPQRFDENLRIIQSIPCATLQ